MTEYWLRGPVDGIAPLLQPVAHALLQAREDVAQTVAGLTPAQLWTTPGGAASVGFHLKHLAGSLDRLFTYARGEGLSPEQLAALKTETFPGEPPGDAAALVRIVHSGIDRALDQVRGTPEGSLLAERRVGRQGLISTTLGLLFHAAEHTTRHAGQAITTAKIVKNER
jgi:uncharacterized damage-inducible protein DinB